MKHKKLNSIDRSCQIFRIIGQVDEDLIAKAEEGRPKAVRKPFWELFSNKKDRLCAVGVLAIVVGIGVGVNNMPPAYPRPSADLPLLEIPGYENSGMGSETYLAADITDLTNANPWTGRYNKDHTGDDASQDSNLGADNTSSDIASLPVIRNKLQYNKEWLVINPDLSKMQSNLKEAGKKLGMDIRHLSITNDIPDAETQAAIKEKMGTVSDDYFSIRNLYMEGPGRIANTETNIKLEISANQTITAEFTPPISLPEEYAYTDTSTYEELYLAAQYIQEHCSGYLDMKEPKINIFGGDYNSVGKQYYTIAFYDGAGSLEQQILNYNFNKTLFYCDEQGKLSMTRTYQPDLTEVIGNYPIISEEEAITLADQAHYQTSVPEAFPGAESVRKIELIYRTSAEDAMYLPYYRIYAELPSQSKLLSFGAYYVPAVESAYIQNMPLWDGAFN